MLNVDTPTPRHLRPAFDRTRSAWCGEPLPAREERRTAGAAELCPDCLRREAAHVAAGPAASGRPRALSA